MSMHPIEPAEVIDAIQDHTIMSARTLIDGSLELLLEQRNGGPPLKMRVFGAGVWLGVDNEDPPTEMVDVDPHEWQFTREELGLPPQEIPGQLEIQNAPLENECKLENCDLCAATTPPVNVRELTLINAHLYEDHMRQHLLAGESVTIRATLQHDTLSVRCSCSWIKTIGHRTMIGEG